METNCDSEVHDGQNRERLLDVLESIQDDVFTLDKEWNFTYINTFAANEWGYTPAELLHRNIWTTMPRFIGTLFEAKIREAMEKQQVRTLEWKALYASGFREVTVYPSREGVTVYAKNITDRKEAENALKESEERFSAAFHANAAAAIISRWSDGKYVDVNDAFLSLFEFSREEVIGHTSPELKLYVSPNDRACLLSLIDSDKAENIEMTFKAKSGRLVDTSTTTKKILLQGQVHIVTTMVDLTERKKAEEALKQTERLYHSIFANTKDGFQFVELIYDGRGKVDDFRFLSVNNAYENQTGLKAAFVVGKRAREFDPNIERYWLDIYEQVDKTGNAVHTINYNENTKRWYDVYTYALTKGKVGSLFRDITDQKNLEKQLHEQERLAAIGATAGMVGHDIRNPLQAMVSDIYLMKDELALDCKCSHKEELIESLVGIDDNISYINKIVQDLQDYARPLNPEYSVVALSSVLAKVFENVKVPESIKLSIDVKNLDKSKVDPMLLQRALSNLVTNAIQAMPNGGNLAISAHPEGNKAVIVVSDTGVGIADEVKPKLFAPMVTTKSKGQGFGLAVSKRIIEAMNGKISFVSEKGKGTKFTVELPSS